jgi:hypothetical protein
MEEFQKAAAFELCSDNECYDNILFILLTCFDILENLLVGLYDTTFPFQNFPLQYQTPTSLSERLL